MDVQQILDEESKKTAHRHSFFNWILPIILFTLTVFTTLYGGGVMSGEDNLSFSTLFKGLPFASAIIFIMCSHAFGHYITARVHGVGANVPYFVPNFNLTGTAGAYTKMKWPIANRNSLIRIFTAGPIAGFCASWLMFIIGLTMSRIVETKMIDEYSITLGDSLITFLSEKMVLGYIPDNKDVFLHPIAYAGWIGLYYNCWHLLPIGKLDGARILYALYGFKTTKWISYCSIIILVILGFFESGWIAMAILGVLCTINFRRQYPSDDYDDEIRRPQPFLVVIALIILIVSLAPNPIHIKGL